MIQKASIGSRLAAEDVARRTRDQVPAYGRFLSTRGASAASFDDLPLMDKAGYLTAFDYAELLSGDYADAFTIFRSSGSSGKPFYWPQLKTGHQASLDAWRGFLETGFAVHQKKTLGIVGLALGSWIGGDQFSWALKNLALSAPYPFTVFSPGNNHDEILEIIARADRFVDQIILFLCPSAIGHLLLRAEQAGKPLPLAKLRYVVLGEPFPESLRTGLAVRSGMADPLRLMFSIYGSADTGTLGVESIASVALRQLLERNPALAASLGFGAGIPHFFHALAQDCYVEAVNGELCVTRWQGIPLVRYNLHDAVRLLDWRTLRATVLDSPELGAADQPLVQALRAAGESLPDLLAISGRSDSGLILCGTNLSETMLDNAVRSAEFADRLSGAWRARILLEEGRQLLGLDLETRGPALDDAAVDTLYHGMIHALSREQPEFKDDWEKVYRTWDGDRDRRILRIRTLPWPMLSRAVEQGAKLRGVER